LIELRSSLRLTHWRRHCATGVHLRKIEANLRTMAHWCGDAGEFRPYFVQSLKYRKPAAASFWDRHQHAVSAHEETLADGTIELVSMQELGPAVTRLCVYFVHDPRFGQALSITVRRREELSDRLCRGKSVP
jgi:hypothetical protein